MVMMIEVIVSAQLSGDDRDDQAAIKGDQPVIRRS